MKKNRIVVFGSERITDLVVRTFGLLSRLAIAEFEVITVADPEALQDLLCVHANDFCGLFVDGEAGLGIGVVRATGYKGHLALLGGPDVAEADVDFYDIVCHGCGSFSITSAICLLLKDLDMIPQEEIEIDAEDIEIVDAGDAWDEIVPTAVRAALASV